MTIKKVQGKWVCKGPQGSKGTGKTREAAMVAYAMRREVGEGHNQG